MHFIDADEPVWAHSGRELFYKGNGNLTVVEVLQRATFVTGERRALFSMQGYRSTRLHQQYDVTPDDQRFVMIQNIGEQEASETDRGREPLRGVEGEGGELSLTATIRSLPQ